MWLEVCLLSGAEDGGKSVRMYIQLGMERSLTSTRVGPTQEENLMRPVKEELEHENQTHKENASDPPDGYFLFLSHIPTSACLSFRSPCLNLFEGLCRQILPVNTCVK